MPCKCTLKSNERNLLDAKGVFLIYEPTLGDDDEDLDGCLDRYEQIVGREWTAATAEELTELFNHVRSCDLPEPTPDWIALRHEAGFSKAAELFQAPTDLFRMFRYRP